MRINWRVFLVLTVLAFFGQVRTASAQAPVGYSPVIDEKLCQEILANFRPTDPTNFCRWWWPIGCRCHGTPPCCVACPCAGENICQSSGCARCPLPSYDPDCIYHWAAECGPGTTECPRASDSCDNGQGVVWQFVPGDLMVVPADPEFLSAIENGYGAETTFGVADLLRGYSKWTSQERLVLGCLSDGELERRALAAGRPTFVTVRLIAPDDYDLLSEIPDGMLRPDYRLMEVSFTVRGQSFTTHVYSRVWSDGQYLHVGTTQSSSPLMFTRPESKRAFEKLFYGPEEGQ